MLHPYKKGEPEYIEPTLEMCTLWKGVPHGLAIIQYQDSESVYDSFRGIGVFNRGELHNTPFIYRDKYGEKYSNA